MTDYIYRNNAIIETIFASRRSILRLFLSQQISNNRHENLLEAAIKHSIKIETVSRAQIQSMIGNSLHQDAVLEVGPYPYVKIEDILSFAKTHEEEPLILILDQLQSPSNFGRLLRSAEAMGVHGVIIQKRNAGEVSTAVVASSMGASEHIFITKVTNLSRTIVELKKQNIWILGLEGNKNQITLDNTNLKRGLAIVIGNENNGIRRLIRKHCDMLAQIPMLGKMDSLNAAVAGSIAIYVARQSRK